MAADGHVGSPGTVHVIVTCTNRKSQPVPDRCHLGSVPAGDTDERARDWICRLSDTSYSPLIAARDLYAGEHWMVACGLPDLAGGGRIRLWACSAGYGLIPADAPVRPYAATFTGGHPDSVPGGADGARAWWHAWVCGKDPSQVSRAASGSWQQRSRLASYLLALSAPYLYACRDDIVAASSLVRDPDRFMVVSAGARYPGPAGRGHGASRRPAASSSGRHPPGAQRPDRRTPAVSRDHRPRRRGPASGSVAGTAAERPPVRAQETQRRGGSRPDRRRSGAVARRIGQSAAARVPGRRIRLRAGTLRPSAPTASRRHAT